MNDSNIVEKMSEERELLQGAGTSCREIPMLRARFISRLRYRYV